ncbi:MAG TPA: FkbM family methyltransferase [Phycisphaerales bacterium]|nr:FkbM family methyltransferase [Phycisphaerales bacterium]HMP36881.1 FkbM family methyltransferase [Phycisphaerales bacterium]
MDLVALKRRIRRSALGPVAARLYRLFLPRSLRERLHENAQYDEQTIAVMRRVLARDSCAIDIGAHKGDILEKIVAIAPAGRHIAFEPIPHLAEALRVRFPDVTVHAAALSDAPGTASFNHVVDAPAYSGLLERDFDTPDPAIERIDVNVETLDRTIPSEVIPAFVKIDVEGGELPALRGGAAMLRRARPVVVFESGAASAAKYGATGEAIFDFFDRLGYRVSLMRWWLDHRPPFTRESFVENFSGGVHYYFIAYPA